MSQLEPLVNELQAMTSVKHLPDFFTQIQQQYQYSFCGLVLWRAQQKTEVVTSGNCPANFTEFTSHVALQQLCQQRCTPVLANETELAAVVPADNQVLLIPLRGFGTDIGALVIGILTTQASLAQQIAWYWTIIANYLYETLHRLTQHAANDCAISLTSREKSCLSWAAKGKTSWEISQILSISERTVNFHLSNCIAKTDSCNRQQAISRCLASGQIFI